MLRILFLASLWVISKGMYAAEVDAAAMTKALQIISPEINVTSFNAIKGSPFFHVQTNFGPIYVADDLKFAYYGSVFDLKTGADLSKIAERDKRKKWLASIDNSTLISYPATEKKHKITVFTDVDCGYCRQFHQLVPSLTEAGVEVRYVAFPRAGVGSESYKTMVAVWCSQDPKKALNLAKQGSTLEAVQSCKHPVDQHLEWVGELGLNGTPTIIFENGEMLPGYVPLPKLLEIISKNKK